MKRVIDAENIRNNTKKERFHKKMMLLFLIWSTSCAIAQNTEKFFDTISTEEGKGKQEGAVFLENRTGQTKKTADSLLAQCNTYIKGGEYAKAMSHVRHGFEIYTSLDDTLSMGHSYSKMATIYFYQSKYPQALDYYEESIKVYRSIDFKKGIASCLNNKGAIYYRLGNYPKALEQYKKAVKLNDVLTDQKQSAGTIQNIGGIYLELSDYKQAMRHFQLAKKTYESISDKKTLSQVLIAIGEINLRQQDYGGALNHFERALKLANEVDDKQRILEALFNLGEIYSLKKEYGKSLRYYNRSLQLAVNSENVFYRSASLIAIGVTNFELDKSRLAIVNCKKGLRIAESIKTISTQKEACNCLYRAYKYLGRNGVALNYYEQSVRLTDSLQTRQTSERLLNMEFEKEMLIDSMVQIEKERKLQLKHKVAIAKKEKQRNILVISGCFVLILAGGLWNRLNYTKKSRARLQVEKDLSEHLLLNILPEEIAVELKEKGYVDAQDFETASILFTDFKSFTETASLLTPQELVEEINVCFKAFDGIMETYNIEKIKTIGDAYMAAGGLPKPDTKAVKNCILAALAMQEFVTKRKLNNNEEDKPAFEMRVGIHVGPIVAGVVGVKKFQYDIWGDTVNTASRMESNGVVGKVNISEDTYLLVKDDKELVFDYRGKVAAKGKGALAMYFVTIN